MWLQLLSEGRGVRGESRQGADQARPQGHREDFAFTPGEMGATGESPSYFIFLLFFSP